MASNPVQSVIDADRFVRNREANPGGRNKDFFEGHDAAFQEHRAELTRQVSAIRNQLTGDSSFGGIGFAKVEMQRSALAKSHRPIQSVFPPSRTPVVGSAGVGTLIVEVTPEAMDEVEDAVRRAEDVPRDGTNSKTGKVEPRPSRARSEVGAINDVQLWTASDKRSFSTTDAVEWLKNPRTGGGYLVELFGLPDSHSELESMSPRRRRMFKSFEEGLKTLGAGVRVEPLEGAPVPFAVIFVRLEKSEETAFVQMIRGGLRRTTNNRREPDLRIERHEALLRFLDSHPLVRSVQLPPTIERSNDKRTRIGSPLALPERGDGPYALVGVVDGGVSGALSPWVLDRIGLLADEDKNEAHGTFIGGLLVAGPVANSHCSLEPPGCDLVDIDLHPVDASFSQYYPKGVADFFDELEDAVVRCRTAHGVRVFNMSLNLTSPASIQTYGYFAARLDALADRADVIFVISAGNLDPADARSEWSSNTQQNLVMLAAARNDGILTPAESVRHVSVAALNPPSHSGCIPFAPSAYSRRGPGVRTGVKPDLAHIGGALGEDPTFGHGLLSTLPSGEAESGCGTSYAAPLVARTIAELDATIEGDVRRETLLALLIHGSTLPEPLSDPAMSTVARDLVGFGKPRCAADMLSGDDHQVTLVFESRLTPNAELVFPFAWPASLVQAGGACRGSVRMTLVSTPPLDFRYGAEFVRVNLDAALQQEQADGSFKGRLRPAFVPEGVMDSFEQDLIDHSLKWGPVKTFRGSFPRGVGPSSNWRLHLSYLVRALDVMPIGGVPFTLVLTIEDPAKAAPVFREMRQSLQAIGTTTSDVRTAARARSRT